MLSFLKGNKTDQTFTLDRPGAVYFPGEAITGTISVSPTKELKLRGGKVLLTGAERYKYQSRRHEYDPEGGSHETTTTSWGQDQFFTAEQILFGETVLPGGQTWRQAFRLDLPVDAPPTCAAEILRVQWQAGVVLDKSWMTDLSANSDLQVRSRAPGLNAQPGEYGQSNEPEETDLAFLLPGLEVVSGGQLAGQLRILPRKEFDSKVRLELIRQEQVYYDQGNKREQSTRLELAGSTRFTPGQAVILPFRLPIPADAAPSLRTANGAIQWTLKGILDRSLRKDTTIEQWLEVYSV